MSVLSPERAVNPIPNVQDLIPEARLHQKRRHLFLVGALIVAVLGGAIALFGNVKGVPPEHHASSSQQGIPIGTELPLTGASTSTAYAISSDGLVPVRLETGSVSKPIAIPNLVNAVVTRDGQWAYALTQGFPGKPQIVAVNLTTRHVDAGTPLRNVGSFTIYSAASYQPDSEFPDLAITPDGQTVLVADAINNSIITVNAKTHTSRILVHLPKERSAVSYTAASSRIQDQYLPQNILAPITALTINSDGTEAYVVDGTVVLPINLLNGSLGAPIRGFDDPLSIAISPDGDTAYVTNPGCWSLVATNVCVKDPTHTITQPNRIDFGRYGDHVSVVDLQSGSIKKDIDVGRGSQPIGVAISPDGRRVYVTNGEYGTDSNRVSIIDTASTSVTSHLALPLRQAAEGAYEIAVSPNGETAYIGRYVGAPTAFSGPRSHQSVYQGLIAISLRSTAYPRLIPLNVIASPTSTVEGIDIAFAFHNNPIVST